MKKRIIGAIIILIFFIPLLFIGDTAFSFGVYLVALFGLYEFLKIKDEQKYIPAFIKFISYVLLTLLLLANTNTKNLTFSIDYRVLAGLFISYLIPTVLYHDRKKYSINDAFYLIGGVLFLGISMSLLILIRNNSLALTIYLFLISTMTDTYAYFIGSFIGKYKLLESISPKKTLEGMIGGTIFGTFIGAVFYSLFVSSTTPIYVIILVTLFLSIIGQFGDLVFSAIKRYFSKKDFSNIVPGHGGVLDRMDSIIFILLGFVFFMTLI